MWEEKTTIIQLDLREKVDRAKGKNIIALVKKGILALMLTVLTLIGSVIHTGTASAQSTTPIILQQGCNPFEKPATGWISWRIRNESSDIRSIDMSFNALNCPVGTRQSVPARGSTPTRWESSASRSGSVWVYNPTQPNTLYLDINPQGFSGPFFHNESELE